MLAPPHPPPVLLGVLVALSLVRELGPVVAGLLFASRAGSAITAEIGLMKATEQLDAMDMMAVNPIARVVAPRFWGGVISMPLLAALFSTMGIFGGWLIGVVFIGVDHGAFWGQMQSGVDWWADLGRSALTPCGMPFYHRARRLYYGCMAIVPMH